MTIVEFASVVGSPSSPMRATSAAVSVTPRAGSSSSKIRASYATPTVPPSASCAGERGMPRFSRLPLSASFASEPVKPSGPRISPVIAPLTVANPFAANCMTKGMASSVAWFRPASAAASDWADETALRATMISVWPLVIMLAPSPERIMRRNITITSAIPRDDRAGLRPVCCD